MQVTVDTYTRLVLTVIAVLLTVIAVALWCEAPAATPTAQAAVRGLPDMSQQLNDIIARLDIINATNTRIVEQLHGELKVKLADPAEWQRLAGSPTPSTPPNPGKTPPGERPQ